MRELEPAGRMARAVEHAAGVVLVDGRVAVIGGTTGLRTRRAYADVQLFDPARKAWSAGPALPSPCHAHAAVRLRDGTVLVAGGFVDNARTERVLAWRPGEASWAPAPPLTTPRSGHETIELESGAVIAFAGSRGPSNAPLELDLDRTWRPPADAEVLELGASAWRPLDDAARDDLLAPYLSRDTAAVALAGREISVDLWRATGALPRLPDRTPPETHSGHSTTLLDDGRILVAGGLGGGLTADVCTPGDDRWTIAGHLIVPRDGHMAVRLGDGAVLLCGGSADTTAATGRRDVRLAELWRAA